MSGFSLNKNRRRTKRTNKSTTPNQRRRRSSAQNRSGGSGHVLSQQTGDEGIATVRLTTKRDPSKSKQQAARKRAQKQRLDAAKAAAKAPEPDTPQIGNAQKSAEISSPPPDQAATGVPFQGSRIRVEAPTTAPAVSEPAPAPEPVGPAQAAPQVPQIPLRIVNLTVDGEPRGRVRAADLMHGAVFEPAGLDEHGQPLYQLRPDAAVGATREVEMEVANDGPAASIALLAFCGDVMRMAQVELGPRSKAVLRLEGALQGHIELGYSPLA